MMVGGAIDRGGAEVSECGEIKNAGSGRAWPDSW